MVQSQGPRTLFVSFLFRAGGTAVTARSSASSATSLGMTTTVTIRPFSYPETEKQPSLYVNPGGCPPEPKTSPAIVPLTPNEVF